MFRTPSVFGALTSGFVPFASGAPLDTSHEAEAAEVIARAAAPAPGDSLADARQAAVWAPAVSARIRVVEGVVLAAICGYFGLGLVRTFAGL